MDSKKKKEYLARFGKNLEEFRKKKNLSFRQLATLCDIDYSDIKKYENGEKDLRLTSIIELASGLGINPKDLVEFDMQSSNARAKNEKGKQK